MGCLERIYRSMPHSSYFHVRNDEEVRRRYKIINQSNMEEVIKYFETIEARLAALEAKEQMLQSKEQSLQTWEERLQRLEKAQQESMTKLQAVGTHVTAMLQMLKQLEAKQSEAVHVAAPMPAPQPVVEEEEVKVEEVKVEEPAPQPKVEEVKVEEPRVEEVKAEELKVEEVTSKASIYGKAVADIRQAISIGDRFLYQRELFEQNAELMQRTLNELDQLHSFAEAMDYINEQFHWDQESNTYQQFIVTLHRRFG